MSLEIMQRNQAYTTYKYLFFILVTLIVKLQNTTVMLLQCNYDQLWQQKIAKIAVINSQLIVSYSQKKIMCVANIQDINFTVST